MINRRKPQRQFRFNVATMISYGRCPKEYPFHHVFKTRWQYMGTAQAKKLFGVISRRFPEEDGFEVTCETRIQRPIPVAEPAPWHPWARKS